MSQPAKVVCGTCNKWIPYSPNMKTGTVLCSAYGIGDWTEKCCWDCSDEKHALIEKNRKELTEKLTAQKKEQKKATKDFLKLIEKTDISSKVEATVDEKETPFMPQFYFKKHFANLTQEEYDEFTQRWVDERRYEEIDDIVRDTFAQWKQEKDDEE